MPKRIMREFALFEVSAVDRPCQEGARMVIAKRAPCPECGGANGDHLEKCSSYAKSWGPDFVYMTEDNPVLANSDWAKKELSGLPEPLRLLMQKGSFGDDKALEAYCKRTFTQAQRDEAERKGETMPGGGFPVANESDLKNAIRAIGRAKNPAAARAHIKTRAKSLGLSDLIPDTWKAAWPTYVYELVLDRAVDAFQPLLKLAAEHNAPVASLAPIYAAIVKAAPDIDALPEGERAETLDGLMVKCAEKLAKIVPAGSVDAFKAAIAAKGAGEMDPKELEKLQKQVAFLGLLAKATDVVKAFMAEQKMDEAAQAVFLAKKAEEQKSDIDKAKKPPPKNDDDEDDMDKALKKRDTEIAELTKNLNVLQAKDELAVCKELCRRAGVAEGKGEQLAKLRKLDAAIAEDTLKEWSAAAKQTNPMLFAELGKSGASGSDDPTAEIMTKAAEIRTAINKSAKPHEQITIEKARVLAREQFPDLAKAERELEQRRRMGRAA